MSIPVASSIRSQEAVKAYADMLIERGLPIVEVASTRIGKIYFPKFKLAKQPTEEQTKALEEAGFKLNVIGRGKWLPSEYFIDAQPTAKVK